LPFDIVSIFLVLYIVAWPYGSDEQTSSPRAANGELVFPVRLGNFHERKLKTYKALDMKKLITRNNAKFFIYVDQPIDLINILTSCVFVIIFLELAVVQNVLRIREVRCSDHGPETGYPD
jgi:hypothetical protein